MVIFKSYTNPSINSVIILGKGYIHQDLFELPYRASILLH